jgi:hypothetical protein
VSRLLKLVKVVKASGSQAKNSNIGGEVPVQAPIHEAKAAPERATECRETTQKVDRRIDKKF